MRKRYVSTALLAASLLLVGACSTAGDKTGGNVKSITVWTVNQPDYDWPKTLLHEFTAATGITVKFEAQTAAQQQQKLPVVMQGKADSYDVIITPQPGTLAAAELNAFAPIDGYLADKTLTPDSYDIDGIPKPQLAQCRTGGKLYCVPAAVDGGPVLFYNKRLLSEAGVATPPTNWDEVLSAARALTTRAHAGICMQGSEASPNGYPVLLMLPYFLPFSPDNKGMYLGADWKPLWNTPGAARWAEIYAQLMQNYAPKQVSSYDSTDCAHDFQTGRVAMLWDNSLAGPNLWNKEKSKTAGVLGVQGLPCPPTNQTCVLSAPYGMFINQNVSNARKTAAWKFITYMTSPQTQLKALEKSKNPNVATRPATMKAAVANAAGYGVPADYLKAIGYGSEHIMANAIPQTPAFAVIQSKLFVTLSRLMTKQITATQALEQLQKEFTETLKEYKLI